MENLSTAWFWLGLTDEETEGVFTSLSGQPAEYLCEWNQIINQSINQSINQEEGLHHLMHNLRRFARVHCLVNILVFSYSAQTNRFTMSNTCIICVRWPKPFFTQIGLGVNRTEGRVRTALWREFMNGFSIYLVHPFNVLSVKLRVSVTSQIHTIKVREVCTGPGVLCSVRF